MPPIFIFLAAAFIGSRVFRKRQQHETSAAVAAENGSPDVGQQVRGDRARLAGRPGRDVPRLAGPEDRHRELKPATAPTAPRGAGGKFVKRAPDPASKPDTELPPPPAAVASTDPVQSDAPPATVQD